MQKISEAARRRAMGVLLAGLLVGCFGRDASADTVTLQGGDVLVGTVSAQDEATVTLEHPVLGTVVLPRTSVASVRVDDATPAEAPAEAEAQAEAQDEAQDEAQAETADAVAYDTPTAGQVDRRGGGFLGLDEFLPDWTKRVELGSSGTFNDSEAIDVLFRGLLSYADNTKRWKYETQWFYGISDGEVDDNEFTASVLRDFLFPDKRHFYFAEGGYEYDQFEDFDHRLTAGGGIGYMFIKRDKLALDGRAGLNAISELGGESDDDIGLEGSLGVELGYQIAEDHALALANTLFPRLDDAGEYRNVTAFEYVIALNVQKGMNLKFGVENEYDSIQDEDPNELRYYVSLVLDL